MRLTIIPSDSTVYKNNTSFSNLHLDTVPSNIHALQWVDTNGWIEFNDGTPNQDISELPQWAKDASYRWDVAKGIEDSDSTQVVDKTAQVNGILSGFPKADISSVQNILSNTYSGLVIGPRIRESDNVIIGVTVQSVSGGDSTSGGNAMLAIRRLTDDCIAKGIPLISNASFPTLSNVQFGEYLKSLGNTDYIDLGESVLVYTPWTLAMAKERKKATINTERAETIGKGITYNANVWDADTDSIAAIIARNNVNQADNVAWRTKDNSMVEMTGSEFASFTLSIVDTVREIYEASWNRKAAVDNATTEGEVNAV